MNELIDMQIEDLKLSFTFVEVLKSNEIVLLRQLLEKSPIELMGIPGLTLEHLFEYKRFLIQNKLQHLQKDF